MVRVKRESQPPLAEADGRRICASASDFVRRQRAFAAFERGIAKSEVAAKAGVSLRTVQRWEERWRKNGGLDPEPAGRRGRPSKLGPMQLEAARRDLQQSPAAQGYRHERWNGALLSRHLLRVHHVRMSPRNCLRLIDALGTAKTSAPVRPATAPRPTAQPPQPRRERPFLSERQLKLRAMKSIQRLASAGLKLYPFINSLFELISEAIPNSDEKFFWADPKLGQRWVTANFDYAHWAPAMREFVLGAPPEVSGIKTPVANFSTAILDFEHQIALPHFLMSQGYNEVFRPVGVRQGLLLPIREQGSFLGHYPIFRAPGAKPFSEDDKRFLLRVAPHIAHATRTAYGLQSADDGSAFTPLADPRLGVVLMDTHGRVQGIDDGARQMFYAMGLFDGLSHDAFSAGRIHESLEYIARTLRGIFETCDRSEPEAAAAPVRVFTHHSGVTLRLRGMRTEGEGGQRSFTVLVEQGELEEHRERRLMARYGLRRDQLAMVRMVGKDLRPREIAARLAISPSKLKNSLQRLTERLGMGDRGELREFAAQTFA